MSRLLLLPLDDRPVNLRFPALLANIAGERLHTPPPAALGHFLTPGKPDMLLQWLANAAEDADIAILSLDMLAYGGLVASRTPTVAPSLALSRLDALRDIKARHPRLRLYAFNVIMRLTITGADAATRAAGRDIFRYSVLADQCGPQNTEDDAAELVALTARIPPALLHQYLSARARNHEINRAALELLADGMLDYLALVQEDTAPRGLHITEQQTLRAQAIAHCDPARWHICPGTDEAAMTLLARSLLDTDGLPFSIALNFRDPDAARHPALFEDRPLSKVAVEQAAAIGGTLSENGLPCAIHTFTPPQRDLFEMPAPPAPGWQAALDYFPAVNADDWLHSLPAGPLSVADIAYCNGGDPHLLDALLNTGRYFTLESYAGWNTAGNTLGTAIAHAAVHRLGRTRGLTPAMEAAHTRALLIRLLDDGLYQPIIRGTMIRMVESHGLSPLHLAQATSMVETWMDDAFQILWNELREHIPALAEITTPFRARLPWERLFEVDFEF